MIVIASDHAGVVLKARIVELIGEAGLEVRDLGPGDTTSVDYPDFAHALAETVAAGEAERGILICGTGIGMSMAANKYEGIRAALCHDEYTARLSREHNDANVLCLGDRVIGKGVAEGIVKIWLSTTFSGGRHQIRIDKFSG